MKRRFLVFFSLLSITLALQTAVYGQQIDSFSVNTSKFLSEIDPFLNAGGSKVMKDLFNDFSKKYKSGTFSPEQQARIIENSNLMLGQKMTARPYFEAYLAALMQVKNAENGDERFDKWHNILASLMQDIENRRLKPYLNYLKFSAPFFESGALRESSRGVSWYGVSDKAELKYETNNPYVRYEEVNLEAVRKEDTISIIQTQGTFYPTEGLWKATGGKVTWERYGQPDVYAELGAYKVEVKSSLYEADSVQLTYPLFFGQRKLTGKFEDKLLSSNKATEGSYPRFTSNEKVVEIENLGEGVEYKGGFRLEGTTVYGFGTKENPARLALNNEQNEKIYRGFSELFTIRRGERIVAEKVESTIYFDQDTLYHPSVNIRFEIPKQELKMSRGRRGSDRNPFFSSIHQVNIEADEVNYYIRQDSILIGERGVVATKTQAPVIFESLQYFDQGYYRRVQNITSYNPIALIKAVAEREGDILNAHDLAQKMNSKYEVENIQSLLYDLVSKGFINYDPEKQIVEVKDKVYHYVDASNKKIDYDAMQLESKTRSTNGIWDLKTKQIQIDSVKQVMFSEKQRVALRPFNQTVYLGEDRDLDFDGRLFAGYSLFEGKDFSFDYGRYSIAMDSVRFFDLFVPTGVVDEKGNEEALSLGSRLEHLSGVLLIDAPENKAGIEEIPIFPSFQSKGPAYVFYDAKQIQKGAYKRDSFYFELKPFSFNSLDKFGPQDINFKGKLVSFDIFPDIEETLVIRVEDQSLGFTYETPTMGTGIYQEKGTYTGVIDLSNKGLLGKGTLSYLSANVNSEDLVFRPKNTTGSAELFAMEEVRNADPEIPQVRGSDVKIDWRPYSDSLYVNTAGTPFDMFKEGQHTLQGTAILTPDGLKGVGLFDWPKAYMQSQSFSFDAFKTLADTTDLQIRAFDADDLALTTENLNARVDFEKQIGNFKANDEFLTTALPYNQYETSFNEFDWNIKDEIITFKAKEGVKGGFLSVHPDQDSLRFEGDAASYNLKTSTLNIQGVEEIISADAFIYPPDGLIDVYKGGKMSEINNARIEADTINKYHVINRAKVQILGKKEFRAEGYYEYNIGEREQEIRFDEIVGTRIGKGSRAEKATATRATGEVSSEKDFYIDNKTLYRGTISLFSETPNLKFEGYARLKSATMRRLHWFTVAFDGDKKDLKIKFNAPKNYQAEPLRTGLYLSKENNRIYSNVMAPLYFRKDRPILPVTGYLDYEPTEDVFVFGDSLKVIEKQSRGNKLTYFEKTGKVQGEGKFNIGDKLRYVRVEAAGTAEVEAPPADTSQLFDPKITGDFMMAIDLLLPDDLKKMLITDFQSSSFDAQPTNYFAGKEFYEKATAELFGENPNDFNKINARLQQGGFEIPKKLNKTNFLFAKVPMLWDPDYQSFISTNDKLSMASIDGTMLNKDITAYLEVKMPSKDDDRVYLYIKSPSDLYYFFGFKQGILNIVSNNQKFNDYVINMKPKHRVRKMKDGETFEIQPVNPGTARQFVSRVQAARR